MCARDDASLDKQFVASVRDTLCCNQLPRSAPTAASCRKLPGACPTPTTDKQQKADTPLTLDDALIVSSGLRGIRQISSLVV
jgi:hypothetical protein